MTAAHHTHVVSEGSGPPLVLVHGVGLDHTMWDAVTPVLAEEHTVVRYDLWGHGGSDDPPGPRSLEDFVDQLVSVIDSLGVERCDAAGLSIGGLITQALGVGRPHRAGRLAMMNAVYRRTPDQLAAIKVRLDGVVDAGMEAMVQPSLDRWFTSEWQAKHPDEVAHIQRLLRGNGVHAYVKAYGLFATNTSMDGQLSTITSPTLVFTGQLDVGSTPAMAQIMADEINDATFVILEDARHVPPVERPAETAQILNQFFTPTSS
jgi:(E)-2-((N-methylformamido)methylene)succinate hydrolase